MNTSQEIEDIVLKVLKRMGQEGVQTKPRLLVMDLTGQNSTQKEQLKNHWHVVKMSEPDGKIPENVHQAVFRGVDQNLLVKGAIGIADTPESRLFTRLMLSNTNVYFVLKQSLLEAMKQESNSNYVNQLRRYKSQLQQFGVNFFSSIADVLPVLEKRMQADFAGNILMKDHLEAWGSNSIRIPSSTIVTPLAYDTAREKGISIHKHSDQKEI